MSEKNYPTKISIALCTCNGEKYISSQLLSLSKQSATPYEIVVGDDASDDLTLEIIENFAKNSTIPVKIFRNNVRLGYRENFLNTARKCTGEVIAFCDQDDIWLPEKLAFCGTHFENKDVMLVCHGYYVVDSQLNKLYDVGLPTDKIYCSGEAKLVDCYPGLSQLFRRSLLSAANTNDRPADVTFSDQKMAHDRWIPFLADSLGSTVFLAEKLCLYRQHSSNLFGDDKFRSRRSLLEKISGGTNHAEMLRLQAVAQSKCDCLRRIEFSGMMDTESARNNAEKASRYWQKVANSYQGRASIYQYRRRSSRLLMFIKLNMRGLYVGSLKSRAKTVIQDFLSSIIYLR